MKRVLLALALLVAFASRAGAYPVCTAAQTAAATGANTITLTHPSCATTGMIEIIELYDGSDSLTVTKPTGYNLIGSASSHIFAYWHAFTNGDGNPTFTFTNPNAQVGAKINVYNDVDTTSPIDQSQIFAQTLNGTYNALTPTHANEDVVLDSWNLDFSNVPPSPPSGAFQYAASGSGVTNTDWMYYATSTANTVSFACVASGHNCSGVQILLNPPALGQAYSGVRGVLNAASNGSSISVSFDPRITNKDVVVCLVGWGNAALTKPTGFNKITGSSGQWSGCNFNQQIEADCYSATGSETGTFTYTSGGSQLGAQCFTVFGASCTTDGASITNTCTSQSSFSPPNITTTGAKEIGIVGSGLNNNGNPGMPPVQSGKFTQPANLFMSTSFFQQVAAGTTQTQTITGPNSPNLDNMVILTNTQTPASPSSGPAPGFVGLYPYPTELLNGRTY